MWPKKGNSLTRKLKPLLPDLRQGYEIDITITRDAKGEKTKNSTWITIKRKISPLPPPSPPEENRTQNQGKGGGEISLQKVKVQSKTLKLASSSQNC
jgi:hypothetical protein